MSTVGLALAAITVAAGEGTVAVSPGGVEGGVIDSRCPAFSWTATRDAPGYELLVFALRDDKVIPNAGAPLVRRILPPGSTSWTPSLDLCLERGAKYAWVIRGLEGEWSEPSWFEIGDGETADELAVALDSLRRQLMGEAPVDLETGGAASRRTARERAWPEGDSQEQAPIAGENEAFGVAALTVEGEVRSVTSSQAPRLWGRGRPGAVRYGKPGIPEPKLCVNGEIHFGLSEVAVDWGSAADACPAGTWVCTVAERGPSDCDTLRPDTGFDGYDCSDNTRDYPSNGHYGWLADASYVDAGRVAKETGVVGEFAYTCFTLPVWCCSSGM